MRRSAIALVLCLALPAVGAAAISMGPVGEQVVEGHTVWVAIDMVSNATNTSGQDFAAAIAVLVQEEQHRRSVFSSRFPGVLWFNDQYLLPGTSDRKVDEKETKRYPCTGVVIAVNRGDPVDQDLQGRWTLVDPTYANESYYITDPNDHSWIIDLWMTAYGTRAWTVALTNNDAGAGTPDDGVCSGNSYQESRFGLGERTDPGSHGMDYPCDGCDLLRYNAVLYLRIAHLTAPNATKDHREGVGADWFQDASACHESEIGNWDCPGGDDSREGNSHPYRPGAPWSTKPEPARDVHGGSASCPDATTEDCHATRDVDVYYGYVTPPLTREFLIVDLVGSAQAYHCHGPNAACGPYVSTTG